MYRNWYSIKSRCKKGNYLKKGIVMCAEWNDSFVSFYDYVTKLPRYSFDKVGIGKDKYTLDRIDNNGNYEPNNVRWATTKEQWANSENAIIVKILY